MSARLSPTVAGAATPCRPPGTPWAIGTRGPARNLTMVELREPRPGAEIQTKPRDSRELPDTYPKGRRCVEPGCITILSRYNPGGWGPWCFRHLASHEHREMMEMQDRALAAPCSPLTRKPPCVGACPELRLHA